MKEAPEACIHATSPTSNPGALITTVGGIHACRIALYVNSIADLSKEPPSSEVDLRRGGRTQLPSPIQYSTPRGRGSKEPQPSHSSSEECRLVDTTSESPLQRGSTKRRF